MSESESGEYIDGLDIIDGLTFPFPSEPMAVLFKGSLPHKWSFFITLKVAHMLRELCTHI